MKIKLILLIVISICCTLDAAVVTDDSKTPPTGGYSALLVNISKIEYFWDSDPGFDRGQEIANTPSPSININISALSDGLHRLYIRAKDESGNWGIPQAKSILVQKTTAKDALPNITNVEYFFDDNDPDPGNATPLAVSPGESIDIDDNIALASLSTGSHRLYIRAKNGVGEWGIPQAKSILVQKTTAKDALPNITNVEYFFDNNDPGPGSAAAFTTVLPGVSISIHENISLKSLSTGSHRLYIRAKNGVGEWGIPQAHIFDMLPNITNVEYFFDNDPGLGNATPLTVSPDESANINENINLASMPTGLHRLYIRAKNSKGVWGISQAKTILVQKTTAQDALPNITNVEYFFDSDPGIGNAAAFTVSPATSINMDENINLASMPTGLHRLYIRAKNSKGEWGISQAKPILVQKTTDQDPLPQISEVEYFINTDPGTGQAAKFSFTPDTLVNIFANIPCDQLVLGAYVLYIRGKNESGEWGIPQHHAFSIEELPTVRLNARLFLEGPYNTTIHQMTTSLNDRNVISIKSPYTQNPRTVSAIPQLVTDWILVQLRSTSNGSPIVSKSAFLRNDGKIVADDGTTEYIILDAAEANYYIVVNHRNHLSVMSSNVISLQNSDAALYDFSSGLDKWFGGEAVLLEQNVYGSFSGDANSDGHVQNDDKIENWESEAGESGYKSADFNLNGVVQPDDKNDLWNKNLGKSTKVPAPGATAAPIKKEVKLETPKTTSSN